MNIPGVGLADGWGLVKKSLGNKLGQKFLGTIATSPLGNYEQEYQEALSGKDTTLSTGQTVLRFIKNNLLAWGYLAVIPGLILKTARRMFSTVGPDGQTQPSNFDTIIGLASNALTYGGPVLAFLGQVLGFHRTAALGEQKIAEMERATMDRESGEKVFEELDVKTKIHQPASKLRNVLTYPRAVYAAVMNRSDREGVETAFVHGPPGSGKSAGAIVILSNWAKKKAELQGYEPIVKQLNMSVLDERAKKLREQRLQKAELVGNVSQELGDALKKDVGDPLLVFELLIKDMEKEIQSINESNKKLPQGQKPKKIAFLLDEYDKIGEMAKSTTDVNRLVRVITRLNSLIAEQKDSPIVITSNKTIKQIGNELRSVIPESLWGTVIRPHLDRLQLCEVFIDDAQPKEQAEIISKYLLDNFPPNSLDIKVGDLKVELTDNRSKNIETLRHVIYSAVTNCYGSDQLTGRQLEGVIAKQLIEVVGSIADDIRDRADVVDGKRLGYTDEEWESLPGNAGIKKALAAEVKIDISLIKKLVQRRQADRIANMEKDDDPDFIHKNNNNLARGIVKQFIRDNKEKLAPFMREFLTGKIDNEKILGLLKKIYEAGKGTGNSLWSYNGVTISIGEREASFIHGLTINKEKGIVQIAFVEASKDLRAKSGLEAATQVTTSKEMPLKDFLSETLNELFFAFGKPKQFNILGAMQKLADAFKSGDVDPSALGDVFDALGLNVNHSLHNAQQ